MRNETSGAARGHSAPAQQPGRQKQKRPDESEHGFHYDAQQPKRNREQPDYGEQDKRDQQ